MNQPLESQVFDIRDPSKEDKSHRYDDEDDEDRFPTAIYSYYEDFGYRRQCKFTVNAHATGFRFMRLVSGRDERFPYVVYDLGWKVV